MNVSIICLGNLKEDYLKAAQENLLGRILKKNQVSDCRVIELKDEPVAENASPAQMKQLLETEGRRILEKIPPHSRVVCLDISGTKAGVDFFTSLARDMRNKGQAELVFIIGGSLGISDEVKARSNQLISFSRLTYPHQLFRIALLDAIALYL